MDDTLSESCNNSSKDDNLIPKGEISLTSEFDIKKEPIEFDFSGNQSDLKSSENILLQPSISDEIKDESMNCFSFKNELDSVYQLTNEAADSAKTELNNEDSDIKPDLPLITVKSELIGDIDGDSDSSKFHDINVKADSKDQDTEDNKDSIVKDVKAVTPEEKISQSCEFCEPSSTTYFYCPAQQTTSVHDGPCYTCKRCSVSFYTPACFKKNRNGRRHKKLSCEECDSSFSNATTLKNHMSYKHSVALLYTCEQCQLNYTSKKGLKNHVIVTHKGKRFSCELCNSSYAHSSTLNSHIRFVHGGKRYSCKQCESSFSLQKSLKYHVMGVHEGKAYSCELCTSFYMNSSSLKQHVRSVHANSDSGKESGVDSGKESGVKKWKFWGAKQNVKQCLINTHKK